MDHRLILAVFFVTLSSAFIGTAGQSGLTTTTQSTVYTSTTSASTATPTTTDESTETPTTTVPSTETPTTTVASTETPTTTVESTETPTTTVASTETPTTTVAALETTTPLTRATAAPLPESVNRDSCSVTALCAAEPSECDPSTNSNCFFYSAQPKSGGEFAFELSGQSTGYIGLTISSGSTPGGNGKTYVCAISGVTVLLITARLNNGVLEVTKPETSNGKGRIDDNKIQCTFFATLEELLNRRRRRSADPGITFSTAIQTGSFNASSGELGTPTTVIQTDPVDLSNPNSTVINIINIASTVAPTTSITVAPTETRTTTVAPTLSENVTLSPVTLTPAVVATTPLTSVTAAPLPESVNRDGCSVTALCAAEPTECDPSPNSNCFFYSAQQKTGGEFAFQLSGQSTGYIGLTLSSDSTLGGNDTTYVCAASGTTVVLITARLNNGVLEVIPLEVSNGQGRIDGNKIQCTFCATLEQLSTQRRRRATTDNRFTTAFQTGSFNTSSGELGTPTTVIKTDPVDLSNPNSTTINIFNITSTVGPITSFTTVAANVTLASTVAGNVTVTPTGAANATVTPTVSGNATVTPTVAGNLTLASTVAGNVTATPTVAANATATPTVAANATVTPTVAANVTTVVGNVTVSAVTTQAVVATTALTSIAAAPLTESINRDGCRETRLCVSEAADCDPSTNSSCFFLSADQKIGRNFSIELSGQSTGYIAISFSADNTLGVNDIAYICVANGSAVLIFTATFHNNVLTVTLLDASDGKGRVDGNKIQCTFCAVLPESSTRVENLASAFHTGTYNAATGAFGAPNTVIVTNQVDFTNANANITNTLNPTTAPPTTDYAPTLHHSLLQTLMVTLAVLGLATL